MDAMLGKSADARAADKLGLNVAAIKARRHAIGLTSKSLFFGKKFGDFTVVEDLGAKLKVQCNCGAFELISREATKPTYQGRKKCAQCAGHPCEICGSIIPARPGMKSATCSKKCAKVRIKARGKQYYEVTKGTERAKETRARAYENYRKRLEEDPIFHVIWRAYYRHKSAARLLALNQSPELREKELQSKREWYKKWRTDLVNSPQAWEAHKEKCRAWYASLPEEKKTSIFRTKRTE